jgi:hypothetical protein
MNRISNDFIAKHRTSSVELKETRNVLQVQIY